MQDIVLPTKKLIGFDNYPNGTAPLTAMMSKFRSESVDDPEYNWWTKLLPAQGGTFTAGEIYDDVAMGTALGESGTAAGTTLYVKLTAARVGEVRVGQQVVLRDDSHHDMTVVGKVTARTVNGANSSMAVKLLEADDNGGSTDLRNADNFLIIGNLNPEGAYTPDAMAYDPVKYTNYTQIFRDSLSITRTARKTRLRTGDQYKEAKREALELHSIGMEKAAIWGIGTENTGDNGQPERTSQGIIDFVNTNASANVMDYELDSSYSGQTWVQGGETWLDVAAEQLGRYGSTEKLGLAGSGALLGLQRLAKSGGQINLSTTQTDYGIEVTTWRGVGLTLQLKRHPLFSYNAADRNSIIVLEPDNMRWRYITDTNFRKSVADNTTGNFGKDATDEEYLTEGGYEFDHPLTFGVLHGCGVDNAV